MWFHKMWFLRKLQNKSWARSVLEYFRDNDQQDNELQKVCNQTLLCSTVCLYCVFSGYCFLIFQDEMSVHALIEACIVDDNKLYWCVSSPTMKDKPVSTLTVQFPKQNNHCASMTNRLDLMPYEYWIPIPVAWPFLHSIE